MRRGGFSLVECIMALLLLSIGVLGLAGAGVAAMRALARADRTYLAATHASAILDSLSLLERPFAGHRYLAGIAIDWQITPAHAGHRIDLRVSDATQLLLEASSYAAPWPPRIGRIP
jgi:prepilin-type N-terminal cleavage/methylation domain-containing protein